MRTLILFLLLPFFCTSQDTLPAILKLQQGNYTSYVKGKVVLTKDCKVVEYLRVNTWKRKERIRKFKKKVVDYRLINSKLNVMNLYLLEQDVQTGYDTYDSCVVAAIDEDSARNIHPSQFVTHVKDDKWMGTYTKGGEYEQSSYDWVQYSEIDRIKVTLIGTANSEIIAGVICASFNAG